MTVYLDNAATTALRPEALDAMLPFLRGDYANPSSSHSDGQRVRRALDAARARTAAALGARPSEIVFTATGTEADNLALVGMLEATPPARGHLITSAIEHHAVLHTANALRARGHEVSVLPVDANGFVSEQALSEALTQARAGTSSRNDTGGRGAIVVSIMHANNEIGAIQRIARLAAVAHEHGALFHTDAVQTVGHVPLDVRALDVDTLALSAHKFEGPKGIGALYVRSGVALAPLVHGGGQEADRRSGTENVPGIVGLSIALELAARECEGVAPVIAGMRDALIDRVRTDIPESALNGPARERLPNNASLRFAGVDGQAVVMALDLAGFEASTGSACASGSLEPSHVLTALGLPALAARSTVRFSLGRTTTMDDIARLSSVLPGIITRVRELSTRPSIGHYNATVRGGAMSHSRESLGS